MSKKLKQIERHSRSLSPIESEPENDKVMDVKTAANHREEGTSGVNEDNTKSSLIWDELFHSDSDCPLNLEWMSKFLEMDESWFYFA